MRRFSLYRIAVYLVILREESLLVSNHSESSHYNTINDDHYVTTYEISASIYAIGRGGPDSLQN